MLIYPYMTADGTIAVKQGVDLNLVLTCDDGADSPALVPFSGASAVCTFRNAAAATLFTASTAAATLALGATDGKMTFAVPHATITALTPAVSGTWEMVITWSDGEVEKWETKPFIVVASP